MIGQLRISPLAAIRLIVASAVAPIAAGIVMFAVYMGFWYNGWYIWEGGPPADVNRAADVAIGQALGVAMIAVPMTGAAILAIWWLASRGPLSFSKVLIVGAVIG